MTAKYFFINDRFVPEDQASLQITDLSIQRGYGIFDFFKTVQGKPIFLEDHLDRFFNSATKMHLTIKQSRAELKTILSELILKNNIPDSGIKITVTGGYSADGFTQPADSNLIITQYPFTIPMEFNPKGISIITYDYQRQLSEMKTIDYSMAIWLQPLIKEKGADDVVYHHNGLLKETPRANFFIVSADQEVITAKNNVLKGVIRKNILNLQNPGFKITERDFTLEELTDASEAFITSTTKHILPVLKIDGKPVGDGKAGPVSAHLSKSLLEKVSGHF